MGVLIASPEAGDASVNIIPHMKKHNAISDDPSKSFVSTISEKCTTNQSALRCATNYTCSNILNKDSQKPTVWMENDVLNKMSSSAIPESCQFPYYRSNKSDGGYADAVLVKDVGISCMLLEQNISEISVPETGTIIKQLKKEYYDLSKITNKITEYTKDILSNLSKKKQANHRLLKNLVSSKHAIASQYVDNSGSLCLKLRLLNNAQTQCISDEATKNCGRVLCNDLYVVKKVQNKYSKSRISDGKQITHEENINSKHEKDIQTIIYKNNVETNTSTPSSPSTSSISNRLMMRENNSGNKQKYRNPKNLSDNDDCKDHLKRCSPILFTNWREISHLKKYKSRALSVTPNESQQTANIRNKTSKEEAINNKTNNNMPEAMFHTVNIRIIKQNKKHL